ncbi:hypothetical protein ATY79_29445 [Rhizobium sp. R693]|nr:hypothetical protein ATY79_29445 [Rhizobium sp. R693]
MPSSFFDPGPNKAGVGFCILRPLPAMTSPVAIVAGGDDVLLDVAASITLSRQVLGGASEAPDFPRD